MPKITRHGGPTIAPVSFGAALAAARADEAIPTAPIKEVPAVVAEEEPAPSVPDDIAAPSKPFVVAKKTGQRKRHGNG